ncbi:hypothetical protein CCAX7_35960 [Capsulimonas corticalis]|uniref:Uncharacterized protein n=1 Tax=Capsulimonas corticalis TaxID=2219043 RepID=A0A402D7A0_9BACT|nr:PAS domain-containing protein [Capsulimonas corticalis]BDI31545.1 hypothetical protein CCAX7_35960 [Capsulimonas corticalis]
MDSLNGQDASPQSANDGDIFGERLSLIADNAPLLIAYLDTDERYQFNNQAYNDWFGMHPSAIRGRKLQEIIGDETNRAINHHVEAAFAGNTVTYEASMPYAVNGRRFVRTTLIPEKDAVGNVKGIMVFVSDDSALHEAQTQIISAYNSLVLTSDIGRIVRSASDPRLIMETTVAALGQSLKVDRCYFATYDLSSDISIVSPEWRRDGIASIAGEHKFSDYSPHRNPDYLAGQTNVIEDTFLMPDSAVAQKLGLRSVLRAPIQQEGRTTALVVAMATESRKWTAQEISLVETSVSLTRGAVEAAHAAMRERAILRDVLASVTGSKLNLAFDEASLPVSTGRVVGSLLLTLTEGLRELRHLVRQATHHAGYIQQRQDDLVTAVSEAGMNAIVHAGGGQASVRLNENGVVQVRVEDRGSGIAAMSLPKATLARGYSTQGTLGHGIK